MSNTEKVSLSLDISTTHIGLCVLKNSNDDILRLESINLPNKDYDNIWQKLDAAKAVIREIFFNLNDKNYEVTNIFIEEALKNFKSGFSSASTIIDLAQFNALVSYAVREIFFIDPIFINVMTARSKIGIKITRTPKGIKKKPNENKIKVFEQVRNMITWNWPTKIMKSGPRKGQTEFEDECFDMADSWVICKAGKKIYP
jgi:hypothetical protein